MLEMEFKFIYPPLRAPKHYEPSILLTVKPIIAADNLGKIDKLYRTIFCTVFGLNKSSNEGDNRRLWLLH